MIVRAHFQKLGGLVRPVDPWLVTSIGALWSRWTVKWETVLLVIAFTRMGEGHGCEIMESFSAGLALKGIQLVASAILRGRCGKTSFVMAAPGAAAPHCDEIVAAMPESIPFRWKMAIRELVVTERAYINELRTIMRGYIHVIPDHVSLQI